jgi:hypothetical protein
MPAYRSEEFDINMEIIGILAIYVVPITNSDKDIIENKGWEYLEDGGFEKPLGIEASAVISFLLRFDATLVICRCQARSWMPHR